MVMQGGRVRERICNMDQERVSHLNVDWRRPEHMLVAEYVLGKKPCSRPRAVYADDASWKEAVRVCVLDVGEVPPYFLNASECGAGQRSEQDE